MGRKREQNVKKTFNNWAYSQNEYYLNYTAIRECLKTDKMSSQEVANYLGMNYSVFSDAYNKMCTIPMSYDAKRKNKTVGDKILKEYGSVKLDKIKKNFNKILNYYDDNIYEFISKNIDVLTNIPVERSSHEEQTIGNRMMAEFGPAAVNDLVRFLSEILNVPNDELLYTIRYFLYVIIKEDAIPQMVRDELYIAFRAYAETKGLGFPEKGSVNKPNLRIMGKQRHKCFVCYTRLFFEWAGFPNCNTHIGELIGEDKITKGDFEKIKQKNCKQKCSDYKSGITDDKTYVEQTWYEYQYTGLKEEKVHSGFDAAMKETLIEPMIEEILSKSKEELYKKKRKDTQVTVAEINEIIEQHLRNYVATKQNKLANKFPLTDYHFYYEFREEQPRQSPTEIARMKKLYCRFLFGMLAERIKDHQVSEYLHMMEYTYGYDKRYGQLKDSVDIHKRQYENDIGPKIETFYIYKLAEILGCYPGYLIGVSDNMYNGYSVDEYTLQDVVKPICYIRDLVVDKKSDELKEVCPEYIEELANAFKAANAKDRIRLMNAFRLQDKLNKDLHHYSKMEDLSYIKDKEENIFDIWAGYIEKPTRNVFINNGLVNAEAWKNAETKVVYLFKNIDAIYPIWDERNYPAKMNTTDIFISSQSHIVDILAKWQFGITNYGSVSWDDVIRDTKENEQKNNILSEVCIMNFKKSLNIISEDDEDMLQEITDPVNMDILNKQLSAYGPDIVVCCGTAWLLCQIKGWDYNEWKQTSKGVHYYQNGKTLYIEFFYPNEAIPNKLIYYGLIDAITEIKGKK